MDGPRWLAGQPAEYLEIDAAGIRLEVDRLYEGLPDEDEAPQQA